MTYHGDQVPRWRVLEIHLQSTHRFTNPCHDAQLAATFTAPSGRQISWYGFWDGGEAWRVRFAPDEEGTWRYQLSLQGKQNGEVASTQGSFTCTPSLDETVFDRHGPIRLADNKRNLIHADGTPFFWMADTAWNGPLRSTDDEWQQYLETRVRQRFNAVQWVATHWRAAREGDIEGQPAFIDSGDLGSHRIAINPPFFRRLDRKLESTALAGLLNVPVMLWAVGGGANPEIDPGFGLPEEEAIVLARYMVARWGAYPLVWILAGDGKYFGDFAARWRRIGRAVFNDELDSDAQGGREDAPSMMRPVAMHCGGEQWPADELREEPWLDILGYQSGHGDADTTLQWIVNGPPATQWDKSPRLFQINFEPAYENHAAYHSRQPHSPHSVRMAIYWSLLNAPTAGVSYGGHGVWGWDDGTEAPMDHPRSGIPLPWQQALIMPAAEQIAHLVDFFTSIPWWTLSPSPQLLVDQPGTQDVRRHITVAANPTNDLVVIYTPAGGEIRLDSAQIGEGLAGRWCNPRSGEHQTATPATSETDVTYTTPDDEDWLLILQRPQTG